jgi:hypothetical protein
MNDTTGPHLIEPSQDSGNVSQVEFLSRGCLQIEATLFSSAHDRGSN